LEEGEPPSLPLRWAHSVPNRWGRSRHIGQVVAFKRNQWSDSAGLRNRAADSVLTFRDDSPNRILSFAPEEGERKAVTTTHIHCETREGHKIALYFTGPEHAGETLERIVRWQQTKDPMLAIADGLAANHNHNLSDRIIEGGCNMHARRNFYELREFEPDDAKVVLRIYERIYKLDGELKSVSQEERLREHQRMSGPLMEELRARAERKVQELMPNFQLYKAYKYLLNHWERLTLFLTVPGAPLDNGQAERGLKLAILHRKNSLFYKSEYGAFVGDVLMSLLFTARLNGLNPVKWLEQILTRYRVSPLEAEKLMPFS
jgi:transposase